MGVGVGVGGPAARRVLICDLAQFKYWVGVCLQVPMDASG